jgi:hypothetical protein
MTELETFSATKAATILNERGVPSAAGRKWSAGTVLRVRRRLPRLAERAKYPPYAAAEEACSAGACLALIERGASSLTKLKIGICVAVHPSTTANERPRIVIIGSVYLRR